MGFGAGDLALPARTSDTVCCNSVVVPLKGAPQVDLAEREDPPGIRQRGLEPIRDELPFFGS